MTLLLQLLLLLLETLLQEPQQNLLLQLQGSAGCRLGPQVASF